MRPSAQPFLWKWVLLAWEWKVISISKAEHLPSFWYRGPGGLGNGLFSITICRRLYLEEVGNDQLNRFLLNSVYRKSSYPEVRGYFSRQFTTRKCSLCSQQRLSEDEKRSFWLKLNERNAEIRQKFCCMKVIMFWRQSTRLIRLSYDMKNYADLGACYR